jgi:hypothetical protein
MTVTQKYVDFILDNIIQGTITVQLYKPYEDGSSKIIGTNVRTRTGKTGFSLYSDYYKNKDFVKVPMKLGEILVHDKDCMHFSSPNLSDDYRIAITSIIQVLR